MYLEDPYGAQEKLRNWEKEESARKAEFNAEVASLEGRIKRVVAIDGVTAAAMVDPTLRLADLLEHSKPRASLKNYESALAAIRSQSPTNDDLLLRALCGKANALEKLSREDEAWNALREAVTISSKSRSAAPKTIATALCQLSVIEERRKNFDAALSLLSSWFRTLDGAGIEKPISHARRYSSLLVNAKRHGEAIDVLLNTLKTGYAVNEYDFRQQLLYQLAHVYGLISRFDAEESVLQEAWIISSPSPTQEEAEKQLRNFYHRHGRFNPTGVAQRIPLFAVSCRNWRQTYKLWVQSKHIYKIHYGIILFDLPWSEVIKKGRSTRADLVHIVDESCVDEPSAEMLDVIKQRQHHSKHFASQALVYIHGYNNTFEQAAQRTAMLARDLDFDGLVSIFAWPSRSGLAAYLSDRDQADVAVSDFVTQIKLISNQLNGIEIHLVAHSTGCHLVLRALERLADQGLLSKIKVGEVIFAHADVNDELLRRVMSHLPTSRFRITSYFNSSDMAMRVSDAIRFSSTRVGRRAVTAPNLQCVDTTKFSKFFSLNHNVYTDNLMVLSDLKKLIWYRLGAGERNLSEQVDKNGIKYWSIPQKI
jgi:esterase/lipase superfamily enzyme